MGKLYIISEDNYMEVLERLQRICNKFKMLEKYTCYEANRRTKSENYDKIKYESKSWGYYRVYVRDGEIKNEEFSNSTFIHVTEHWMRLEFKNNPNSFNGEMYLQDRPLIHLHINVNEAMYLSVGDKVKFQKWGFVIYTDNSWLSTTNQLLIYKHTFIIDRLHRIDDLNKEILTRDEMQEEESRLYEERNNEDWDDENETLDEDWGNRQDDDY